MKIVIAITGASGVEYGIRLAEELKRTCERSGSAEDAEIGMVVSEGAKKVMKHELGKGAMGKLKKCGKIYSETELDAEIASGSALVEAMVICPCSMKTLSAIAHGFSDNLITRCADVMLKEKRKLMIVPRETPVSAIHLENMLKLSKLGAIILPASPGFYHNPKTRKDFVDFIVGKVLDSLGVKNKLYKRWG